ncbi:Mu transposase domain-containing protein, partial [Acinetobacter soli]
QARQLNYHIQVERMFYSVPYDYTREDVDVRLTANLIEVYFKDVRIAYHTRLKGVLVPTVRAHARLFSGLWSR